MKLIVWRDTWGDSQYSLLARNLQVSKLESYGYTVRLYGTLPKKLWQLEIECLLLSFRLLAGSVSLPFVAFLASFTFLSVFRLTVYVYKFTRALSRSNSQQFVLEM